MKSKLLVAVIVSCAVLPLGQTVLAHHGSAAYADDITEFKQATVTKVSWINPHVLVDFDAKDAKGTPVHVVVETAAPQALRLIGWSKDSLTVGEVITVRMYLAKNGNPAGRLQKIVLADGTELHDTVLGSDEGGKKPYRPQ